MKTTWPVCACEYQFIDEGLADLTERLKEMLDIDVTINDLDTTQEIPAEIGEKNVLTGRIHKVGLCVLGYISYFTSFPYYVNSVLKFKWGFTHTSTIQISLWSVEFSVWLTHRLHHQSIAFMICTFILQIYLISLHFQGLKYIKWTFHNLLRTAPSYKYWTPRSLPPSLLCLLLMACVTVVQLTLL